MATPAHGGHNHLLEVNVGDLGSGLSLGAINILDGGTIHVPSLGGAGLDWLAATPATSGVATGAPAAAVVEIVHEVVAFAPGIDDQHHLTHSLPLL